MFVTYLLHSCLLDPHNQGRLSLSTDGDKCAMVNFFLGGGMKNQLWGNEKV